MLPRRLRLKGEEAKLVRGNKKASKNLLIYSSPSKEGGYMVVVSSKTAPSAVLRHKIKRCLYEVLRQEMPSRKIVVIALKGSSEASLSALAQELKKNI